MASINIRAKGATAERELATELNTLINVVRMKMGLPILVDPVVQRNQNQTAVGGCDLVGTFGYAIEVKRQENLAINTWWEQCVKSAETLDDTPVLIYRQNGKKWRVVMMVQVPIVGSELRQCLSVRAEISFEDFEELFKQTVRLHYESQLASNTEPAVAGLQTLF